MIGVQNLGVMFTTLCSSLIMMINVLLLFELKTNKIY